MPTYEYRCTNCGNAVEVFQRIGDDPLTICDVCGGTLRKVFHPAGIVFKGSGFYATDSRSSSKSASKGDGEAAEKTGSKDASDGGAGGSKKGGSESTAASSGSGKTS